MNDKERLLEQIQMLSKKGDRIRLEEVLEKYLEQNKNDLDVWLRLALLEVRLPFADSYKSIECAEKALEVSENSAEAVLLLAYVYHYTLGGVDDQLVGRIRSIHTNDREVQSMLTLAQSWGFIYDDLPMYEKLLLKSVEQCQDHVWNLAKLGTHYIENGRKREGEVLLRRALRNVKKVYRFPQDSDYDPIDVATFLNESFKGIYMTNVLFSSLQEKLGAIH